MPPQMSGMDQKLKINLFDMALQVYITYYDCVLRLSGDLFQGGGGVVYASFYRVAGNFRGVQFSQFSWMIDLPSIQKLIVQCIVGMIVHVSEIKPMKW